jgi:hypothetical protein
METIVVRLESRARSVGLDIDDAQIFELLALAWCPICCRDGARGGNDSCGPKEA